MIEDKVRAELDQAVARAGIVDRIDRDVIRRARRRMLYSVGLVTVACVAILGVSAWLVAKPFYDRQERVIPQPADQHPSHGLVREDVPERTRAEIFAFRALAQTGLMVPLASRTYNWTYEDDTTFDEGRWRVGFAASDCAPKDGSQTCVGLSGDDPKSGNALADTYVIVALEGTTWRVVDVEGNMRPEERDQVVGFSLRDRPEPSHWEFRAGVARFGTGKWLNMIPIWAGPYPTRAPGSVCTVQLVDANGAPVGKDTTFYEEPPNREFERGGWVKGTEADDDAADAVVECHQRTGSAWRLTSASTIVLKSGEIAGATLELKWYGGHGFTAPAVCNVTLVDESDTVVWQGTRRLQPLWRQGELKNYPYRASLDVLLDHPVDAARVGNARCRSL